MTAQFDALTQLFEQITERLIRIETKLDGKADLNVVGALEGRIRSLEIADAKRDQLREEFVPRFLDLEGQVRGLTSREDRRNAIEGFKLDTWQKKVAAATAVAGWLFSVIGTVIRVFGP